MNLQRKRHLIERMLRFIDEYFRHFGRPVPLRVVSAYYLYSMDKHAGGMHTVLEELEADGTIEVRMKLSGGKLILRRRDR